jgi:hypothetical protein
MYTVKRWFLSKSVWFGNLLTVSGGWLVYLQGQETHVLALFGQYGPQAFVAIGLAVVALRVVTSGKIAK